MDGTPITHRNRTIAIRILLGMCVAFPIPMTSPKGMGAEPPRFQLDSHSGSLIPITLAAAGTETTNSTPRVSHARPTVVRPRANVIDAKRSPMVAMLSPQSPTPSPVPPQPGTAARKGAVSVEQALATKGSVTFRQTPLSEVVFLLSELWHINIVAGEGVTGEVNGSFHDTPLREVLAAALTASGYSYRKTGNSLVVLPADQIGSDAPEFVSETILLPPSLRGDDSTLEAARLLLSERGQLQRVGERAVLVLDERPRVDRIRQLFKDLTPVSQPIQTPAGQSNSLPAVSLENGIAYFTPQFTEAEEMAEPLQLALGEGTIVAAYPEENRIMVKGTAEELRLASQAIQQLDRPRPQVRITAMIYDVGLADLEQLGINWFRDVRAIANGRNELLADVTESVHHALSFASDLTTTGGTSVGIKTITDKFGAGVFLEALNSTAEAKLLADPSITVADRSQASIRIVRKIPIVGSNPIENSNAVFTQTEFEEAGVILNVMPRISRDGTIELKVQPEYSVVAEITTTGPVIDSRTADTTVRVSNGQMFVLGGLRQKSVIESVRGIPYLKDMKHFGKLFRAHDTEVRESELIVFLRPEIITPCDFGQPRQQRAACVASTLLDEIPYAEPGPMIPCCKDPYCPNHHPCPRINGGSRSLEMLGGNGLHPMQGLSGIMTHDVIPNTTSAVPTVIDTPTPARQWSVATPPGSPEEASEIVTPSSEAQVEELYPPIHIDPRVLTGESSR